MRELTPETLPAPFGAYAHGTEIPAGWRVVLTSGQLPLRSDGTIPEDAESQSEVCFENILAILSEAGMAAADVAHISAFVTDRAHMEGYMRARDNFMDGTRLPSSTLVIVSGFSRPEFKIEVEVIAAKR